MPTEILIKASHGGKIAVREGQILEIVNIEGQQICDFFAFNTHDLAETLSPAHCRSALRRIVMRPGDKLVSKLRRPMLEIVADSCGTHDMTFPPCDPNVYKLRFGFEGHRSCRTNLAEAMAEYKIPYEYLPEPINFFQNTPIMGDGRIEDRESAARPGDKVVLRALMDVIAVGSACPMIGAVNAGRIKDLKFVVRDA